MGEKLSSPITWERRQDALKAIHDAKALPYEVWLGYNANGDFVEIRRNVSGKWYKRAVKLAGVTDVVVVTWDKFEGWNNLFRDDFEDGIINSSLWGIILEEGDHEVSVDEENGFLHTHVGVTNDDKTNLGVITKETFDVSSLEITLKDARYVGAPSGYCGILLGDVYCTDTCPENPQNVAYEMLSYNEEWIWVGCKQNGVWITLWEDQGPSGYQNFKIKFEKDDVKFYLWNPVASQWVLKFSENNRFPTAKFHVCLFSYSGQVSNTDAYFGEVEVETPLK